MARYGTFKYSTRKYGVQAYDEIAWGFVVDWDNNGTYEANEAARMMALETERGRDYYLKSDGTGFDRVISGRATAIMDNHDGRYDPYNTSSPLYGYIVPGRRCKIFCKNGSAGSTYNILWGVISDIQPINDGKVKTVRISVVDGLRWLLDRTPNVELKTTIDTDNAIGYILDAVDWPAEWGRSLEDSTDTIAYWWTRGASAADEIFDLAESGLGTFFISNSGQARYITRSHTAAAAYTLTDAEITNRNIPQPWEVVRNITTVIGNPLRTATAQVLWTLADKPSINAGASVEYFISYSYNAASVPANNVITPVATTDYTMNTAADGSGTNLTGSFAVAITKFSKSAKLTITNNSASSGFITFLQVRGDPIYPADQIIIQNTNAASVTAYGPKELTLNNTWTQDTPTAESLASFVKDFLVNPRIFPVVVIEQRPELQYSVDLFDRVTLDMASVGINENYQVGSIRHTWLNDNGQSVRTTFAFEPVFALSGTYWTFPAQMGIDTIFGF